MKIKVNEIELNYEVIGKGKPLIFIHGNGEDLTTFDSLVEALKGFYTCYLIDSRNHGKSSKTTSYHYDDMAKDIYEFIKILDIKKPSLFGFSDGAIIGMILAFKYPDLLGKLILAGGNINPLGVKKKFLKLMEEAYLNTKNPLIYLMLNEPNLSDKELSKIVCPVLILAGQNDVIKLSHTKKIHTYIRGSKLMIISNHTHESYIMHSNYLKDIIKNFA